MAKEEKAEYGQQKDRQNREKKIRQNMGSRRIGRIGKRR